LCRGDELITPGHTGPARIVVVMSELSSTKLLGNALREVADRLRALPESRLVSRVSAAEALARRLVEWAHGIEHRDVLPPPPVPQLPTIGLFVTADQVAVAGADLLAAADGLPPDTPVWVDAGTRRVRLAEVLAAATAAVAEVRARL
jgi:hypothetical protein